MPIISCDLTLLDIFVVQQVYTQAGAELGKAQLKLELGFTSTKIWSIALMIANCYLLHNTEDGKPVGGATPLIIHTHTPLPTIPH